MPSRSLGPLTGGRGEVTRAIRDKSPAMAAMLFTLSGAALFTENGSLISSPPWVSMAWGRFSMNMTPMQPRNSANLRVAYGLAITRPPSLPSGSR